MDLYRPVLAKALFPAFEAMRGRPTMPLLRYLQETERWPLERLADLQVGFLRRLMRHAYRHTAHYRALLDERGLRPEDFTSAADVASLDAVDSARPVERAASVSDSAVGYSVNGSFQRVTAGIAR